MQKLLLSVMILVIFYSCKKSEVEYETTIPVLYEVTCDSCYVKYRDYMQQDSSKKVYDHFIYSFSSKTGNTISLEATNVSTGNIKLEVSYSKEYFSDTTSEAFGSVRFTRNL